MIKDILKKRKFDLYADRLGPDCPFTHWRLYFKTSMRQLCENKFGSFSKTAEFRPGAIAFACSKIFIGDNVVIRPGSMLFADPTNGENGKIILDKDVMIGSGVHIYVANHRFDLEGKNIISQGHTLPQSIYLKEGCWIGANTVILPGVTIGKNAVVGAGSIVTKDIPSRTLYAGNPAKFIKNLDNVQRK